MRYFFSTKNLIVISLSLYLSLFGLLFLSSWDLGPISIVVSILNHIIGFICIILIPGTLVVHILDLQGISTVEKFLFSIGLSLGLVMLVGLFMNNIYPLVGINQPLSIWPLLMTMTIFILMLSTLAYYHNRTDYPPENNASLFPKGILNPTMLYLILLPSISILGNLILTVYANNIVLIINIIMIILVPILFLTNRNIPDYYYVVAILAVAITLLFNNSCIYLYPKRLNVDGEFFFLNLAINNSFWNFEFPAPVNSVISVTILGTILSKLLSVSIFQVLTVVYTTIFACVPITLYTIYKHIFNQKIAFFSVLFFIFNFYFFNEALLLRRQQVALLFMSLLVLLIINSNIKYNARKWIFVILSFALITSHYAIAFLSVMLFSIAYILKILFDGKYNVSISHLASLKTPYLKKLRLRIIQKESSSSSLTGYFILTFIILAISWYLYISLGNIFIQTSSLGINILDHLYLFDDLVSKSPTVSHALGVGFFEAPLLSQIYRLLQYLIQFLIVAGFFSYIILKNGKFMTYTHLTLSMTAILISVIVIPFASMNIAIARIYFISLVLLSPFGIVGAIRISFYLIKLYNTVHRIITDKMRRTNKRGVNNTTCLSDKTTQNMALTLFATVVLIPFLLFNSGLIFEIGGFTKNEGYEIFIPFSDTLSANKVEPEYYTTAEIFASIWNHEYIPHHIGVYGSPYASYELISAWSENSKLLRAESDTPETSYIFLRDWDLQRGNIPALNGKNRRVDLNIKNNDQLSIEKRDLIYNNKKTVLYGESRRSTGMPYLS